MDKLILNSYAKLNLYLVVLNKRRDNYHNIKTIFERIDLSDKIILQNRSDKRIKIICSSTHIPGDGSNLAYRSAKFLQDKLNIKKGADIKIIKRIPVGAGLGGGSSNAATVLLGLNKLWKLNLAQNKLVNLARNIGSDVPFFIYNTSFAEGSGRGDRIEPIRALNKIKFWHILVVPRIEVSTLVIYKKWDEYLRLTRPRYNVKILISALKKKGFSLISKALFNSLEEITTKLYPEVMHIKRKLVSLGLKTILMSGSGPAVFGIVASRREGQVLCRQLKRGNRSWQVFVTQTV